MAKGIYVGTPAPKTIQGDIIPKSWTAVDSTNLSYVAEDGTIISADSDNIEYYEVVRAVDGNEESYFKSKEHTSSHTYGSVIIIKFPIPIKILKCIFKCSANSLSNFGYYMIQGSNDNSTWDNLTSQVSIPNNTMEPITLDNPDYYSYYKFYVSSKGTGSYVVCNEIQTTEYEVIDESATTGKARKVKKAYVGVDSKARKIKKGYIGVGGIARQFFSGDPELAYYGRATNLSSAKGYLAATTLGNYALFGGGSNSGSTSDAVATVDTYTTDLTKGTATALSQARQLLAAATSGNYALFAGGADINGNKVKTVDSYYIATLAKSTRTSLKDYASGLKAISTDVFAIFAGGWISSSTRNYNVDYYNSSGTKSTATALTTGKVGLAMAYIGGYTLIGGGTTGSSSNSVLSKTVETYNSSMAKGTTINLSLARLNLAATSIGKYALFGGGQTTTTSSSGTDVVDTFDSNLVLGTAINLSAARGQLAATSTDNFAIFAGGYSNNGNIVDTFTPELIKGVAANMPVNRSQFSMVTLNNYVLLAGSYKAEVDVYEEL